MAIEHDLVIRGATIADGSGAALYDGDIAVRAGKISGVGKVSGRGREEYDGRGKLATPGFVDIHTHYDGHATWSNRLAPSSNHGVTTAVMGNCGVGFAPCKPADRERLICLMEGVEDIPEIVLSAGLPWAWTTFPEYMDFLATRSFDMDICAQLPHGALRVFVMGKRGAEREKATPEDMAAMAALAGEAVRVGAIGFSTSRAIGHKASDGSPTPSLSAAEEELTAVAMALKAEGRGVLQCISDFDDLDAEFGMIRRIVERSGRPLTMSLMQFPHVPDRWRDVLRSIEEASEAGLPIKGQVFGRPVGILIGLELSFNPFFFCPSYLAISHLSLAERVAAMRTPELRRQILDEFPTRSWQTVSEALVQLDKMYVLADSPEYEPAAADSIEAMAVARGQEPKSYAYDLLLQNDGRNVIYIPIGNFVGHSTAAMEEMLWHKDTVLGLGDGGAHCGLVCDASYPTYMLTRWKGTSSLATLPNIIKALAYDTASIIGLDDRGLLRPGRRADINILDLDRMSVRKPEMIYDLPEGGGRLTQRASGYAATFVGGQLTYRDGVASPALPGRLVRGAQADPAFPSR